MVCGVQPHSPYTSESGDGEVKSDAGVAYTLESKFKASDKMSQVFRYILIKNASKGVKVKMNKHFRMLRDEKYNDGKRQAKGDFLYSELIQMISCGFIAARALELGIVVKAGVSQARESSRIAASTHDRLFYAPIMRSLVINSTASRVDVRTRL